ncbi:MAG: DUF1634 domain-containing protein [Acidobacteriota bacterium]
MSSANESANPPSTGAPKQWTDLRIEILVGLMLRSGVLLAAAIVLFGGVLYLIHSHGPRPDYEHFRPEPAQYSTVSGIVHGVAAMNPESIIMLGLLVLVATPVARVGMCIVGFLFERDHLYTAVSTIVLLILLYSLIFHK